jgi:hypothetical protein
MRQRRDPGGRILVGVGAGYEAERGQAAHRGGERVPLVTTPDEPDA